MKDVWKENIFTKIDGSKYKVKIYLIKCQTKTCENLLERKNPRGKARCVDCRKKQMSANYLAKIKRDSN